MSKLCLLAVGAIVGNASFARALPILADGCAANPTRFVGAAKDIMFAPDGERRHARFVQTGADVVGDGKARVIKAELGDGAGGFDDGAQCLVREDANEGAGLVRVTKRISLLR